MEKDDWAIIIIALAIVVAILLLSGILKGVG